MNKPISIILAAIAIVCLSAWSAETSISGKKEHKINVKGTITTTSHPDPMQVQNIALGGLIEKIFFYPIPINLDTLSNHILTINPEEEKEELDFVQDIAAIKVADATDVWHYQQGKNKMKDYVLVEVELKNKETARYFLPAVRTITYNIVKEDVVIEATVALTALKTLTITSTIPRDQPKKQKSAYLPRTTQKISA